jgi:predicted Fe-Mo cluster-binding NifX family protein
MAITQRFDIGKLFAGVRAKVDIITDSVLDALQMACLEVTNNAKALNTYKDQTHYLRSSIGFVVFDHGEKIAETFTSTGGEAGSAGAEAGREIAEEAAKQYTNEIVAVIVAGADYALYVESKGYDVISGPCSELNEVLSKYLKIVIEELR